MTSGDLRRSVSPSVLLQESLRCGREVRCGSDTLVFVAPKKKKEITCPTKCRRYLGRGWGWCGVVQGAWDECVVSWWSWDEEDRLFRHDLRDSTQNIWDH